MKIWLTRVASCSGVSVLIVFAGLWVTSQFNRLGISLEGTVALAVGISLTNVIAVILMDLMRKSRGRTDPLRLRSHVASQCANLWTHPKV
jgi:hypothetical protein